VLRLRGKRQVVITRCTQCHILFLTGPGNRRRQDLRCPFGCRDQHRRREAQKRSRAYYQTPVGKASKRKLNEHRYRRTTQVNHLAEKINPEESLRWPNPFLQHVQFVVRVIDKKRMTLSQTEVLLIRLLNKWRQRSLEFRCPEIKVTLDRGS
jgi:hypothetical protein